MSCPNRGQLIVNRSIIRRQTWNCLAVFFCFKTNVLARSGRQKQTASDRLQLFPALLVCVCQLKA